MTFVTHAQNFEDLMLWRALGHLERGFYIDVGAAEPDNMSVTHAFYTRGWSGVNVEPEPAYFEQLAAARPRDVNLRCLLGEAPGEADFYHITGTGLSTLDRSFAERHLAAGLDVEVDIVPMATLAQLCDAHAPGEIHFLKIDVEGAEEAVLRGANFTRHRPWIVLLEATEPNSPAENWQGWEPLLLAADYRFAWFDGLNRFYLAAEHEQYLAHAFRSPPNVFDKWVRAREQGLEEALRTTARELTTLRRQFSTLG